MSRRFFTTRWKVTIAITLPSLQHARQRAKLEKMLVSLTRKPPRSQRKTWPWRLWSRTWSHGCKLRVWTCACHRSSNRSAKCPRPQAETELRIAQQNRFSMFLCLRGWNSWRKCRRSFPRTESSNRLWNTSLTHQVHRLWRNWRRSPRFSHKIGFNSVRWSRLLRSPGDGGGAVWLVLGVLELERATARGQWHGRFRLKQWAHGQRVHFRREECHVHWDQCQLQLHCYKGHLQRFVLHCGHRSGKCHGVQSRIHRQWACSNVNSGTAFRAHHSWGRPVFISIASIHCIEHFNCTYLAVRCVGNSFFLWRLSSPARGGRSDQSRSTESAHLLRVAQDGAKNGELSVNTWSTLFSLASQFHRCSERRGSRTHASALTGCSALTWVCPLISLVAHFGTGWSLRRTCQVRVVTPEFTSFGRVFSSGTALWARTIVCKHWSSRWSARTATTNRSSGVLRRCVGNSFLLWRWSSPARGGRSDQSRSTASAQLLHVAVRGVARFASQLVALETVDPSGWSVKPKLHMFFELCSLERPALLWKYRDDYGGSCAALSRKRSGPVQAHATSKNPLVHFTINQPLHAFRQWHSEGDEEKNTDLQANVHNTIHELTKLTLTGRYIR